MTASFVSDTHQFQESSSSMTVTVPSGVQDGDVLLAFFVCRDLQPATISGWTQIWNADRSTLDYYAAYYRVASSEPSSYSWTWADARSVPKATVNAVALRGVDSTTLLSGVSNTDTAPSINAPDAGLIVGFWGSYYGGITAYTLDSAMTEIELQTNLNSSQMSYVSGYEAVSAGATGTRTSSTGSAGRQHGGLVYFAAAAGGMLRRHPGMDGMPDTMSGGMLG